MDRLDAVVEIPMVGTGQSLNVAVAGSPARCGRAGRRPRCRCGTPWVPAVLSGWLEENDSRYSGEKAR
jgi:hypothetical protein